MHFVRTLKFGFFKTKSLSHLRLLTHDANGKLLAISSFNVSHKGNFFSEAHLGTMLGFWKSNRKPLFFYDWAVGCEMQFCLNVLDNLFGSAILKLMISVLLWWVMLSAWCRLIYVFCDLFQLDQALSCVIKWKMNGLGTISLLHYIFLDMPVHAQGCQYLHVH